MSYWPLFDNFPGLEPRLAPVALAALPTPVHPLVDLGEHAWIKRDDLTHAEYGGNKIRKLEFVLADIRARGAREVITLGATGTNAGVATSMICALDRLGCEIITFPQEPSPTVEKNQRWMQHYGARFDHRPSLRAAVTRFYLHPKRLSPGSYFLFAGCSNPISTFAYINAAFELRKQIDAGLCPEPGLIVLPVSSASTLAGLHLGTGLAGLKSRVLGVRVAPEKLGPFDACTPAVVQRLIRQAQARLPRTRPGTERPLELLGDYFGPGYGQATPEAEQAIALFGRAGIALESTYTGKAAAAFLDALKKASTPVLFWNTFNSRPLPHPA